MLKGPLIPVLTLAVGIIVSKAMDLPWWCGAVPIIISLALYFVILKASSDPVAAFRIGKWHIVWVILLFLGIGMTDESLSRPQTLEQSFGENIPQYLYCEVTGVLSKTYGERLDVVINGTNGSRARIRTGVIQISEGDIIKIPSDKIIDVAADTTEFGRKIMPMMKAAGILYCGRISSSKIETIGKSKSLRYFFTNIREQIETKIERSHLSKSTADFLKAILMGDKTGLDDRTRLTFANGGMAHMLALSGLHIGIIAGFLMLLMFPIKLAGRYKWGYLIAIIILWVYVAVTGFAYSSVRACIMTSFAFIGIIAERKSFVGNALCSACLLILLMDPNALYDAGFQLSVVCVGALIAIAPRINPIDQRHHPVLYYICGAIIATMVATGASWVLTSYYFSQIPLMFLPSNLLLLPLLPVYLSIGAIFTLLLCFGLEIRWIGNILDYGYQIFLKGSETLSVGSEFVINHQISIYEVYIWLLFLSLIAFMLNKKTNIT